LKKNEINFGYKKIEKNEINKKNQFIFLIKKIWNLIFNIKNKKIENNF